MRHIGIDLHKNNLVACFLDEQDRATVKTFALTEQGLSAFRRSAPPECAQVAACPLTVLPSEKQPWDDTLLRPWLWCLSRPLIPTEQLH